MFLTFSQIGYFSSNCIDNKRIQFYRLYLSWVPFSLPFSHNMYGMAVDMHARNIQQPTITTAQREDN